MVEELLIVSDARTGRIIGTRPIFGNPEYVVLRDRRTGRVLGIAGRPELPRSVGVHLDGLSSTLERALITDVDTGVLVTGAEHRLNGITVNGGLASAGSGEHAERIGVHLKGTGSTIESASISDVHTGILVQGGSHHIKQAIIKNTKGPGIEVGRPEGLPPELFD